jgi:putative membrane protein
MPLNRLFLLLGGFVLLAAWAGPLPSLSHLLFSAYMSLHMLVVGLAAPLLALGLVPIVQRRPWSLRLIDLAIFAGALDFLVIWGWHAPGPHLAARTNSFVFVLEQASFLLMGIFVWLTAFLAPPDNPKAGALKGAASLLFTSMHMTLLGALIGLSPRALYAHSLDDALPDQQIGGVIMLAAGSVIYLAGGLVLVGRLLTLEEKPA